MGAAETYALADQACRSALPLPDLLRTLREKQVERRLRPWREDEIDAALDLFPSLPPAVRESRAIERELRLLARGYRRVALVGGDFTNNDQAFDRQRGLSGPDRGRPGRGLCGRAEI